MFNAGGTVLRQQQNRRRHRTIRQAGQVLALGCLVALAGGCADSTIHTQSAIADVETLSLDAKQRLVFVANRQAGHGERVTCTEPMPDALVARAAVLAASGNITQAAAATAPSGGGGVSGGSAESAASIGFRNEVVQMLRDGYYRLCEAYMNGALTKKQYQHMIMNADTFMVVISALQTLGNNPVAPAVAITTGNLNAGATPPAGTNPPSATAGTSGAQVMIQMPGNTMVPAQNAKNAEVAAQIVSAYLRYRMILTQAMARSEAQDLAWKRRHKGYRGD